LLLVVCGALVWAAPQATSPQDNPPLQYIGADECGRCHKSKATGNQLEIWKRSAHANAFKTLSTDAAVQIAKKLGIAEEPQVSPRCLPCHTTGAGQPKSRFGDFFEVTQGVQCESCHGPGSVYGRIDHMIQPSKAHAAGLIEPTAAVCKHCHNAQSPTFEGFDFTTAVRKIRHPLAPL
jgi:hypothetical protein